MEKITFKNTEDGSEVIFSVLDKLEISSELYLLVIEDGVDEDTDTECYIMKAVNVDDDDVTFVIVDDEDELDTVAEVFETRLDETIDKAYLA